MNQSKRNIYQWVSKRQLRWLLFGLISLLLRMALPASVIEQAYARGLYPWIRRILDGIHSLLPIHWFWVLILGLLLIILGYLYRLFKAPLSLPRRGAKMAIGLITVLLSIAGLFLWLWGYNYGRENFYKQIDLEPIDISLDEMKNLYASKVHELESLRSQIVLLDSIVRPGYIEDQAYQGPLEKLLKTMDLAPTGKPKLKKMKPQGFLLRLGTSGFYNPLSGEPNIDPGLHPLQIPFVSAHELAHAYGITDEGACNFLAVLVGREMKAPVIRYAFELAFFRYIRSQFRRMDEAQFKQANAELPLGIKMDLRDIRRNGDLYPDFFPALRDRTYELYLKTQGIEEGLGSYRKVVNMIAAWDKE